MKKEVAEVFKATGVPDNFFCSVIQKEVNLKEMTLEQAEHYFLLKAPWLSKKKKS